MNQVSSLHNPFSQQNSLARSALEPTFYIVSFLQDLMKGDIESCLERTRSFFASIPHDLENKTEKQNIPRTPEKIRI